MRYYKVLAADRKPCYGGTGQWLEPPEWMPEITGIIPCKRGYHLVTMEQLPCWLGPEIWEAEGAGKHIDHGDKHVFSKARLLRRLETWNERTLRLFTADCAEHVLPIYEAKYPQDDRPRKNILEARQFANGEIAADAATAYAYAAYAVADAAHAAVYAATDATKRLWQSETLRGYLYPEGVAT